MKQELTKQLDAFQKNLPDYPRCTNDLEFGCYALSKSLAITKKTIQHNHTNSKMWMVFDIDRELNPYDIMDLMFLPPPNLFIQNPENGRSHVAYSLEVPVHMNPNSNQKVIRYAGAVECAMRKRLDSDLGYTGFLMKNPLHKHWNTTEMYPNSYDLDTLASFLDLTEYGDRRIPLDYGIGRNVTLFNKLRFWAYRNIYDYRPHSHSGWIRAVEDKSHQYNCRFEGMLPHREVGYISKSVHTWVWNKYWIKTPPVNRGRDAMQGSLLGEPDKLVLSALNTNKARIRATQAKIDDAVVQILQLKKKVTQKAIMEVSGLHRNTVQKYCNREYLSQFK